MKESFPEEGIWKHRDLLDLGGNPEEYIEYPGGNGFFFSSRLLEELEAGGVSYSYDELEEVFLPFLKPHIRRVMEGFRRNGNEERPWRKLPREELMARQKEIHPFDKRRLHFLRVGRVDIGNLEGRPWSFLNVLLGKSRDEIEHVIEGMERVLRPHEMRPYLYSALDLQRHFSSHLLRNHPAALDRERVENLFVEEVCRLSEDRAFFMGIEDRNFKALHPLLVKYVVLYFDNDFGRSPMDDYLNEFILNQQYRAQNVHRPSMAVDEAFSVLGVSREQWERMSRADRIRVYRAKAKEAHPDMGGNHETFVRMKEAYETLLRRK